MDVDSAHYPGILSTSPVGKLDDAHEHIRACIDDGSSLELCRQLLEWEALVLLRAADTCQEFGCNAPDARWPDAMEEEPSERPVC